MFLSTETRIDRRPIMSGPTINTIFLDSPIGGDRNLQFQFLRNGISTAILRNVTHATFQIIGN